MKVISEDGKGNTLVEFENLVQHTKVIGVMEPVRALVPTAYLADLEAVGQAGRQAAQRALALFAEMRASAPC